MTVRYASENLRVLRYETGRTAREIARNAGVTEKTIYSWESGSSSPSADHLAALADALDVSVLAFFEVVGR